ncbi:MAG: hypothetical protein HFP81_02890 [Methylococcales symbiont of Hymedesmia sp. n. MRB-2018]|nr:MAG: hypothetical protein HFP78_06355 [Methylococcales symbiont of Hymedesmia sp. n. MRB-2018]KAF3984290.1 MAG: hypothetical protein HFP81_02890 [Methylococcales symbiont of Hymedesmia sp. n. MRB-2018]
MLKTFWDTAKTIRFHSMLTVVFYVSVVLIIAYGVKYYAVDFLLLLFLSGALGGTISTYIRVKSLPLMDDNKAITKVLAIVQIHITPIVAGVLGFFLYLLFASGIVTGALFPEFSGLEEPFETAQSMIDFVKTKTNLDGIKALVWAFIAGFSERMVPNILDKIVQESEENQMNTTLNTEEKTK